MRKVPSISREMALMAASLAMAAAREHQLTPVFLDEAHLIIEKFPDCGLTPVELATQMERVFLRHGVDPSERDTPT
jgi:hypothetical protein